MNSHTTAEFRRLFNALPSDVQKQARKAFRLWLSNPQHAGLRLKKVHRSRPIYSVRIALGWRALGAQKSGEMTWFWIGSHADYDALLAQI